MTEKTKKQEVPKGDEKQRTVQDLSDTELKALAFEIDQGIKQKQREYNVVMSVLQERAKQK